MTEPSTTGKAHHCERFSKPCSHINSCTSTQTTCISWMMSNLCHSLTSYVFVFARKVWEAFFSKLGNLAFGTLTWNWSQVEECGQYQSFDLKLSNSATEFKSVYAERFPNALVWDSQALSEAICFSCDFTGVLWFLFSFQIQRCCISPLELRTYPKILERKQTDNGSMRWMVLCPRSRHPVLVCAFTCVESKFFFWWRTFENNQSMFCGLLRWSRKKGRPLSGLEMMAAIGFPVTRQLASALGVPLQDTSMLTNNKKAYHKVFFSSNACPSCLILRCSICISRHSWQEMVWTSHVLASLCWQYSWPV